jgi:chromosome segregation ATPase
MAAEDGIPWTQGARRQTLAAQALRAASADKRVAELEHELDQLREQLMHQQNRAASLETSLALKTDENSRLSERVTELSADLRAEHQHLERARLALATVESERIALEKSLALKTDENSRSAHHVMELAADLKLKHDQLEQARLALAAAESERTALQTSFALKTDETSVLSHRVTELSADLQITQDQLERARLALAAAESERIEADEQNRADISARDHKFTRVSARAESAEKRLDDMQQRLRSSESEIEGLKRAQGESNAELARRGAALVKAEHTITSLCNLFWQLDSAVRRQWQGRQNPDATAPSLVAECSGSGSIASGILERDLGQDAWLFERMLNGRPKPISGASVKKPPAPAKPTSAGA